MKKLTKLQLKVNKLENEIKKALKKGVSQETINNITGGKSIISLARSKNYDRYLTVIKERYGVQKTISKSKEKNIERKIIKIEKITGIKVTGLQTQKYGIPNKDVIKMSEKEYIEARKMINSFSDEPLQDKTIEAYAKRDYRDAKEKANNINVNTIKKDATEYTNSFLEMYFKNAPIGDYKMHLIHEYMNNLSVQKKYDVLDMLQSDKFKKLYDSDENNIGFDSTMAEGERAELRQEQLLKILRNETGLIINYDKGQFTTETSKSKKNSNTIDNYM